jgi:phosphatidylglycerophosphatase A
VKATDPGPELARVLHDPVLILAFAGGAGCLRPAPGTWGTLVGVPFAMIAALLPAPLGLAMVLVLLVGAVGVCGAAARRLGVHDHSGIVLDEIAAFVALGPFLPPTVAGWVAGFAAFRLFDALKPWPIRAVDRRVHGGFGIVLDDVLAALAALAVVWGGAFVVASVTA